MSEGNIQNKTSLTRPIRRFQPQRKGEEERIKTWMAVCMVIVALFIDGIQTLLTALGIGLVFGPVISLVAYLGFFIWFWTKEVYFTKSPKKMAAMGFGAVIEFFLSFLPGFTAGIVTTILLTKAEDRGGVLGKSVK